MFRSNSFRQTLRFGLVTLCIAIGLQAASAQNKSPLPKEVLDQLRGTSRDLNPPVTLNSKTGNPKKTTVLIYYANESAPDEAGLKSYRQAIKWLRENKSKSSSKTADSMEKDLQRFPAEVRKEIATIKQQTLAAKLDKLSVALFTNAWAHDGKYLVYRAGADDFSTAELKLPTSKSALVNSHPLSNAAAFLATLNAVADQFDPQSHQFVLITKSHGTRKMAMVPRLMFDVAALDRESFLQLASGPAAKQEHSLDKDMTLDKENTLDPTADDTLDKDNTLDPSSDNTLGKSNDLGADPLMELGTVWEIGPVRVPGDSQLGENMPLLSAEGLMMLKDGKPVLDSDGKPLAAVAVSKAAYLAVLAKVGADRKMQFPLLFIESCKSQLDEVSLRRLRIPQINIGRIYTSDLKGLRYTTLDYNKLFALAAKTPTFSDAVHQVLFTKHLEQKNERLLEAAAANADAAELPSVDPVFDRYINPELLARAWQELDAAALTDAALLLAEGERILLRPHRLVSSDAIFELAIRVASQESNVETLKRLAKATAGRAPTLAAKAKAAVALGGAARSTTIVIPDDGGPHAAWLLRHFRLLIRQAQATNDAQALDNIKSEVLGASDLSEAQIKALQQLLGSSRDQIGDPEQGSPLNSKLRSALDQLSAASRTGPAERSGIDLEKLRGVSRAGTRLYNRTNHDIYFATGVSRDNSIVHISGGSSVDRYAGLYTKGWYKIPRNWHKDIPAGVRYVRIVRVVNGRQVVMNPVTPMAMLYFPCNDGQATMNYYVKTYGGTPHTIIKDRALIERAGYKAKYFFPLRAYYSRDHGAYIVR